MSAPEPQRTMSVRHEKAIKFLTTMMEKKLFDFEKFDANHDGFISQAEFTKGFADCGYTLGDEQIADLVEILDGDGDGQISMTELDELNTVTLSMAELKAKADGHDWDGQLAACATTRASTLVLYGQHKGDALVAALKEVGSVDCMDSRGITCLMHAVVNDDKKTAGALLKAGANPCKREACGSDTKVAGTTITGTDNALTLAVRQGWCEEGTSGPEFRELLAKSSGGSRGGGGAGGKKQAAEIDWDAVAAISTLDLMCKFSDDAAGLVAELGADTDQQDKWGFSCLHHAYIWGNTDQADALVAAGASLDLPTTKERQVNAKTVTAGTTPAQLAQRP